MSLLSENIIPGEHGKIFSTNATEEIELIKIKNNLLKVDGVIQIQINTSVFPKEFTVITNKLMNITEIEQAVKAIGYHAIPKELI